MNDRERYPHTDSPIPQHPTSFSSPLAGAVPDVLDEAVALCKAVQRIVALAHGPYESAESIDVVLALDGAAVLVDLGDGNLDRSVVLGLDDAVGGAALTGDVTVKRRELAHFPR